MNGKFRISLIHYNSELTKGELPPLGILYLSSYLKKNGFDHIHPLDLMLEKNQEKALIKYLKNLNSCDNHLIGFYMNTHTRFEVQKAIALAREILPNSIICCGVPHPTLDRESTMRNCQDLDFLVSGEGEETLLEIAKALSRNFNIASIVDIIGTSVRFNDEIIHNLPRPRIRAFDKIPPPDRDSVDIKSYKFNFPVLDKSLQNSLVTTSIISSRGCPFECIFCSVADQWGRLNTYNSPSRVIEEIKNLKEKHGINCFYFFDDTFTLNRKRVIEICNRLIAEKVNVCWFCEIHANTVDEELLSLMYDAGLRSVAMGVESASPKIMKYIVKKGITLEQATKTIETCKKLGIYIKVFYSYSYPEETLDDVKLTLDYMEKIQADRSIIGRLRLYPGTPLFKFAKENKMLHEDFDWFNYYPFYNSVSNDLTCTPLFKDKLSFSDFLFIDRQIAKIKSYPARYVNTINLKNIKNYITTSIKILITDLKKVKTKKDIVIVFNRYINDLRVNFLKLFGGRQ